MFVTMNIDYWKLKKLAPLGLGISYVLLALVLIPGVGRNINGAQRWLAFAGQTFMPAEIAKVALVVYMAHFLSSRPDKFTDFWHGLVPPLLIMGGIFGLIMAQPDMGTALAVAGSVGILILVAGARWSHLIELFFMGVAGIFALAWVAPYRHDRLMVFMDPWKDPQGDGWQIIQSLYAIGSGGVLGLGLGRSRQKFGYLPEPQTDFIFAITAEELGFIGATLVILLFVYFLWRGYRAGFNAPDCFGALLAIGATSMIALQAFINIAVVTSSMPATGIPLPFISSGGTSLAITLAAVGMVLNVSRYSK
jgi:cell division protein FtsW